VREGKSGRNKEAALKNSEQGTSKMKGTRLKNVEHPVVLYGCETWFLILSEEYGLGVFQNKVLR